MLQPKLGASAWFATAGKLGLTAPRTAPGSNRAAPTAVTNEGMVVMIGERSWAIESADDLEKNSSTRCT